VIVAGFGCRASATARSLEGALAATGATPHALALPADRAALAEGLGLPVIAVVADTLAAINTPTCSPASLAARGVGSIAEAAALAAAGPGARLIVARRISPDRLATCAIAEGPAA
jgi:cobalt-precorrin 5A hydrolase